MPAIPIEVTANHDMRRIGMILSNGHKVNKTMFTAHDGLIIYFRTMYDEAVKQYNGQLQSNLSSSASKKSKKSEQVDVANTFLNYLETYLVQAVGHVPQAAKLEEIPSLLEEVRSLVEKHGALPIIQQMLRYEAAALDHF